MINSKYNVFDIEDLTFRINYKTLDVKEHWY